MKNERTDFLALYCCDANPLAVVPPSARSVVISATANFTNTNTIPSTSPFSSQYIALLFKTKLKASIQPSADSMKKKKFK